MAADTAGQEPEPIPAATLVIFRNAPQEGAPPEILMVVRSKEMIFAGGAAVFPGGRIDPEDFALAAELAPALDRDDVAARIAAIRETLEETGLAVGLRGQIDATSAAQARAMLQDHGALAPVLQRFNWQVDLQALTLFARWVPRGMKEHRIFDTRFYLANLGTGAVDIAVDDTENTHLFWTSAQGALDAAKRGEIRIIFPTARNLERLAQFGSFDTARSHAEATPVRVITPWMEERDGQRFLHIPEDAGYPVTFEYLTSAMRG